MPFFLRQLEDQKEQMKFNRNPQLHTLMKGDNVRSEQLFEKKETADAATIKADVVNKIVREYSGDVVRPVSEKFKFWCFLFDGSQV